MIRLGGAVGSAQALRTGDSGSNSSLRENFSLKLAVIFVFVVNNLFSMVLRAKQRDA